MCRCEGFTAAGRISDSIAMGGLEIFDEDVANHDGGLGQAAEEVGDVLFFTLEGTDPEVLPA